MPITAFTGPPGAGKSHALVKDVIVPAILAGRRVVSNIDGLNPDAIRGYCLERVDDASKLGEVVTFHGADAIRPGFWPDEETEKTGAATVVRGGDLVVFDEWKLYFPNRGKWPPGCNVEAFLRWHRHLTGEGGQATDVAIGTQLATDIHQNVRGLIARSYKFKKLTALGAEGTYSWLLFDGHLQPKGGHYRNGTGRYDPAVFPLYASSAAAGEGKHVELRTNRKDSIWSGWKPWAVVIAAPLLILGGPGFLWLHYRAAAHPAPISAPEGPPGASRAVSGAPSPNSQPAPPSTSPWRIVGLVQGDGGTRVIVADDKGAVRMLMPMDFEFDRGRPVRGLVDGQTVVAEDRVPVANSGSLLSGMQQQ